MKKTTKWTKKHPTGKINLKNNVYTAFLFHLSANQQNLPQLKTFKPLKLHTTLTACI